MEASLERQTPAFALPTLPAVDFELAAVVAALVVLLGAILSLVQLMCSMGAAAATAPDAATQHLRMVMAVTSFVPVTAAPSMAAITTPLAIVLAALFVSLPAFLAGAVHVARFRSKYVYRLRAAAARLLRQLAKAVQPPAVCLSQSPGNMEVRCSPKPILPSYLGRQRQGFR